MMPTKKYSVVLLLNKDGTKVLLQKKDRTAFAGKWNGCGGKVEDTETPAQGVLRKIEEETSLTQTDIEEPKWIGTLITPEQCDPKYPGLYPELWFFTGIVKDESLAVKPEDATEEIAWFPVTEDGTLIDGPELAGNGNLPYFIRSARRLLFGRQESGL